ncbi:MAG: nitroreductase family protein [Chlorobium sp.]
MNETIQSILKRRSIRAYQPGQIDEKDLQEILNAGQYAPTAMGEQPWHFTVIQNPDLLSRLQEICKQGFLNSDNEALREIAKRDGFLVFYQAPTLIIVSGHKIAITPLQDSVLAMENMLLAATSLGIGSCWVHSPITVYASPEGPETLKSIGLDFPEGHVPYAAAVFGYSSLPVPEAAPRKQDTITYIR